MTNQTAFNPQGKKILFVSAHPDDADFGAGGSALQWLAQGAQAAIVIATNGNKGTEDNKLTSDQLAKLRHKEQLAASEFLGLDQTWFLDYEDAHLEITQELKEKIVRIIRIYKPDVIVTFDPTMVYSTERGSINHPDHRAVGQATLDALFPMARDFLTFPHHAADGLEPHKVTDIFMYNWNNPNFYVDITPVFEKKLDLIALHTSQVDMPTLEPQIREWNAKRGAAIGTQYAEAFVHLRLE